MQLIHGDCLPTLRAMPSKSVDLLLTDPPYGIGMSRHDRIGYSKTYAPKTWDASLPARACFHEMLRIARRHVIWGGNHFTFALPPSRGWLVWWKCDGLPRGNFADCELAWTSLDRPARVFNSRWSGFVKDSRETRVAHPTQKALEVMKWCVSSFSEPGETVIDPFMGSGTTGVACVLLGRRFVGVERDMEYMEIARRRILMAEFDRI